MEYKLTFLIVACAFSGSLAILCDSCSTNAPGATSRPNCSFPEKVNCTYWPRMEGETVWPFCINTIYVYASGVIVKNGVYKQCGYQRKTTLAKTDCPKRICHDLLQTWFRRHNMTLKSCQTECCYESDKCYSYGFSLANHLDESTRLIFLLLVAMATLM